MNVVDHRMRGNERKILETHFCFLGFLKTNKYWILSDIRNQLNSQRQNFQFLVPVLSENLGLLVCCFCRLMGAVDGDDDDDGGLDFVSEPLLPFGAKEDDDEDATDEVVLEILDGTNREWKESKTEQ